MYSIQLQKTLSMRKLVEYIGFQGYSGVKSKETRCYQKGKCNGTIFSTQTT